MSCGTHNKECCICFNGDKGCLATLHDDYYIPATKNQVEQRLLNGEYSQHTESMQEYLNEINIDYKQKYEEIKRKCSDLYEELISEKRRQIEDLKFSLKMQDISFNLTDCCCERINEK